MEFNKYMLSLSLLFLAISIVLILLSWKKQDNATHELAVSNNAVYFLFTVFALALVFRLGYSPKGLHVDEAGSVSDAINIAKYGTDRYLNSFPVYFVNFDGGQNALMTYLLALEIKFFSLFNKNIFAINNIDLGIALIRFPAVIINYIAYVCFYKILRMFYKKEEALVGIFVAMFLPFSIMHSRYALESYLLFPLLLISSYYLLKAINSKRRIYFFTSGCLFGITLYTYAISYFILPIFLLLFGLYLLKNKKINFINSVLFVLPLAILAAPLIIVQIINLFDLPEMYIGKITLTKLPIYRSSEVSLSNVFKNLKNGYVFKMMLFDGITYNSFFEFTTIYYFNIPFSLLGFYVVVTRLKENSVIDVYVFMIFISIFFTALLLQENNVNKINAIYFPLIYFILSGYLYLMSKSFNITKILLILTVTNFVLFSLLYYFDIRRHFITEYSFINAAREAKYIAGDSNRKIYIDGDCVVQPYIYVIIYNDIDAWEFNSCRSNGTNILYNNNYEYFIDNTNDDEGIYVSKIESYFSYDHYNELLERGFTTIAVDDFMIYVK